MNKQELKTKVKENLEFAKEMCERNDENGGVQVMLITDTSKGDKKTGIAAILANEGAVEKRRDIVFDLGVRAGIELLNGSIDSVNAVFMVSEAWFSEGPKDSKAKDMVMPSEDPNKKEAIVSTGMSKDGDTACGMFELKRSFDLENGKLKISFAPIGDEKGKEKDEAFDSPLLRQFWNGVELMEQFDKSLPLVLKNHIKGLSTEKAFAIFSKQLQEFRNKKN